MDLGSEKLLLSISDASQSCSDLFQSCLLRNPGAFTQLEAAERLFRAWTNNLMVFSKGASLDKQLYAKKYEEIRQTVMLLLKILNENLYLALKLVSSDQNEPFVTPSLEIPLFGINGSLERLEKVAAVIIQATQGSLIKRAIVFAEKHEGFQEAVTIFSLVILSRYHQLRPKDDQTQQVPLEISENHVPTKEKVLAQYPEGLFLALVKTSIVRHFRILYERSRINKEQRELAALATPAAPALSASGLPIQQDVNPTRGDTVPRQARPVQTNASAPYKANQTAERGDEARSEKQATVLSIDVNEYNAGIARIDPGNTIAHGKIAPSISEAGVAAWPKEPKIPDGQKTGTCPICKQEFPAEKLKGVYWRHHVIGDIKPYVCIFEDCMSNIRFFERRRHWRDHMHKVHTPLWIRYLQRPLAWRCLKCRSTSPGDFIYEEKLQASFIKHIQQYHPDTSERERQHLVSHCGVPQPRSSEYCPICGTPHRPHVFPQVEPQSEVTEENTRAKFHDSGAQATKDASKSHHKRKVRFATPETSDDETRERSAEISSSNPSSWHSTRATDDHGVENCIAEHLRALAFYFTTSLINDGQRDPDTSSPDRGSDSGQLGLEDLSEVGSEDDPPRIPSGKCDEIDLSDFTDKEKSEMKDCINKNIRILCVESEEQTQWTFDWVDGLRHVEPNGSNEEWKILSADPPSNDFIWNGVYSEYVPAYVACLFMIVGLCKKMIVSSDQEGDNERLRIRNCLDDFSGVREAILWGLKSGGTVQKSKHVLIIEQSAKNAEDIREQLLAASKESAMLEIIRATITDKLSKTERRLHFCLGLAHVDGSMKKISVIDTTAIFNTILGERHRHAIEDIIAAIRGGNSELLQIVAACVDSLVSGQMLSSERENPKSLKKILREVFVWTGDDGFIPRRQLQMICNRRAVAKELAKHLEREPISYESLASSICYGKTGNSSAIAKPYFRIFAILVLIDKAHFIGHFQELELGDDDLPFSFTPGFHRMWPSKRELKDCPKFPKDIDDEFIEDFVKRQWSVLAPSFQTPQKYAERNSELFNYETFDEKIILPITNVSSSKDQGGFGIVQKVQLHKEHHDFIYTHFALKTFHSTLRPDLKDKYFRQELDAFQKATPGNHLIDICAAFKKGDNYHFLFPWANGGTLFRLWRKHPQDIIEEKRIEWSEFSQWICVQCHGIFRDLLAIHDPHSQSQTNRRIDEEDLYGIHGDIKPDNILHFTEDGVPLGSLKVSDLGLTKFHRLISRTMPSRSLGAAYQSYRSPEHDMDEMRSRKIDIWAFGCLFAELVTWAIVGQGGIEHFQTLRVNEDEKFPDPNKGSWFEDHFFTMRSGRPKRKASIKEWFTEISKDLDGNTFFPQFLLFIRKSMLHPDRQARADCKQVVTFLERCLENPAGSAYWKFNGTGKGKYSFTPRTTDMTSDSEI